MSSDDPAAAAARLAEQLNEEGLLADLETRHVEVMRERDEQRQRADALQKTLAEVQIQLSTQEEKLRLTESDLASAHRNQQIQEDKRLTVEAEQKTQQERMDRMQAEADSLREEISRLTESNSTMTAKLAEAGTKKMLSSSSVIPLQYETDRLRKELDSLTSHSQWLESELATKNDQLASTKTEHSHELIGLRAQLDKAIADRDAATSNQQALSQNRDELQSKVEKLSAQLFQQKQEANDVALATKEEIAAENRLVELQKEQLTRMEQRHKDVVAQMESMRELASRADTEYQENLERVRNDMLQDSRRVLEEQVRDHRNRTKELEDQLEEANRRRIEAEDGLMASPRGRLRPIAASTTDAEGEPLGLTECYSRLAETEDALRAEQTERRRQELFMQKIQAELEAKAPVILRQRQEYELAVSKQEELQTRLDEALDEVRICRSEESDLREEAARVQKKVNELKQENIDLAKQVQALLRSRAGGDVESISWDDRTGDDIPVCITIEEIQNQNQRLLREHRRLTSTVSELEEKLRTDPLRIQLEATEKELSDLRQEREHQQNIVATIVQQRDLMRALLASHNIVGGEGGTSSEDVAALVLTQQQTDKSQAIERRNKELENDLAKAHAELSASSSTHEAMEDRIARYEAHTAELTSSVTKLEAQLTSANAAVARSEADAAYHRDKGARTEEALRLSRDEIARANDAKRDMQSVNEELQKAVSAANAEAGRREHQVRQVETKLRLAETQLQTAKAAETRLALEANSLRSDVARQGALLDSVQRIEASLSAKNEEDKTKLTEESEKLSQTLVAERSKHAVDLENLNSRIRELELSLKSIESKKDEALSELVAAKKESLSATSEQQALATKCSRLEAELRSTKKKLGDEEAEADEEEMNLQTRIDMLTADLDAARQELAAAKERVATFQNMAKTSENALAELNEAAEAFKKAHSEETQQLKNELETVKKESETKQEFIGELTKDLANQHDEQERTVSDLKDEIAMLKGQLETAQKDAESATARLAAMTSDITSYRSEATMAQNNYERELALHASARTSLRSARDEADAECRLRKSAEEQVDTLKAELTAERKIWDEEKSSLVANMEELEKSLEETRNQNKVLHSQLETLGDLVEKRQSEKIDSLSTSPDEAKDETPEEGAAAAENIDDLNTLRRSVSEYREVISFMRSEREMFQAQLDSARRTAERERAASSVTKRSLDDARAELKLLQSTRGATGDGTSTALSQTGDETMAEKLKVSEEQLTLLRESNILLREESEKMQKTLTQTQSELASAIKSLEPTEQKARQLEVDKAVLVEEKASLARETSAWKNRVNSLVSKFHQIDPSEHEKALQQVEGLQKESEELKLQKNSAEKESNSAKAVLSRLNKELAQQRTLVETQKRAISKMSSEKEDVTKSSKVAALISKERDQLKEKTQKLESEAASRETELKGAIERNESLKTRLRQFQKMITEMRTKEKARDKELALLKAKELERSAATPAQTAQQQGEEPVAQEPSTTPAAKVPAAAIAKVVQKEEGAELPRVPPGGFKFGPGGTSAITEAAQKTSTEATSQPLKVSSESDQQEVSVEAKQEVAPAMPAPPEASGDSSKASVSDTPTEEKTAKKSVPAKPAKIPLDKKGATEAVVDASAPQKRKATTKGKGQEVSLREKLMQKKRKLAEELKKAGEERTSPPRKRSAVVSSEGASNKAVQADVSAPKAVDESTPLSPEAKPWAPPSETSAPAEATSEKDTATPAQEMPSSETTAPVAVATDETSGTEHEKESAEAAPSSETAAPIPAEESAQAVPSSETVVPVAAEEPSAIEPAEKATQVFTPSPQEPSETEPTTTPASEQETVETAPAGTTGADKEEEEEEEEDTPAAEAEAVSESKPTNIFGSSTPAFGSGGGFGSGAPFGSSSTSFGKAAGVPPTAFGSSPTLMTKPSQSATAFGTMPSGGGTSTTPAFGSGGGAFLNLKPPGSTSAPLTFGSSATIKLPTPSKTLAAASTTFGAFGQPVSTSPPNPFGGGTSSQAKPLFGGVGLKRPAPVDNEEEKEGLKIPRIETETQETEEVNEDTESEEEAEVVEGEI